MDVLKPVKKALEVCHNVREDHLVEIDEVALLFSSEAQLARFVRLAKEGGLEHFNSVKRDTMRRQDTLESEEFVVRFEFLRIPGAPWRIEAMCVVSGTAPLHEAHLQKFGNASVVHASYKQEDLDLYMRQKDALMLTDHKFQAEYRNSYGLFSYWGGEDDFYFKPRVNLRD